MGEEHHISQTRRKKFTLGLSLEGGKPGEAHSRHSTGNPLTHFCAGVDVTAFTKRQYN